MGTMKRDDVVSRTWRAGADARRVVTRSGSARSALASFGRPDRRDLTGWMAATSEQHEAYRLAHPVPEGRTAIICVSMRPDLVDAVVDNITRQQLDDFDVVFVANSPAFDRAAVERAFEAVPNTIIDHAPTGTSLGAALNRAMERTDARFVAKFDDDDLYGSAHLADSLRAHGYAGAGVVGKHTYYARLAQSDETLLRFAGHEFRSSGTLAGGTMVIDRDRVGDQRFDDISLGEDRAFLARCHRRGISTFSADRFNFVQMRTGRNTWAVNDATFRRGCASVSAADAERIDR